MKELGTIFIYTVKALRKTTFKQQTQEIKLSAMRTQQFHASCPKSPLYTFHLKNASNACTTLELPLKASLEQSCDMYT